MCGIIYNFQFYPYPVLPFGRKQAAAASSSSKQQQAATFDTRKIDHFWTVFGPFLQLLGPFWDNFGIVLGSFWGCFVIILGTFWERFGARLLKYRARYSKSLQVFVNDFSLSLSLSLSLSNSISFIPAAHTIGH
jgi:hypothetical protein